MNLLKRLFFVLPLVLFSSLGYSEIKDSFEPANRFVYKFNQGFDTVLFRPAALVYRDYVPNFIQNRLHDFSKFAALPRNMVNSIFQLKFKDSFDMLMRLWINGVLGVGGFYDFASQINVPFEKNTMRKTLYAYGVEFDRYVVLPFMGPTTVIKSFTDIVDSYFNLMTGPFVLVSGLELRKELIEQENIWLNVSDSYRVVRDVYIQNQNFFLSDFDSDFEDDFFD